MLLNWRVLLGRPLRSSGGEVRHDNHHDQRSRSKPGILTDRPEMSLYTPRAAAEMREDLRETDPADGRSYLRFSALITNPNQTETRVECIDWTIRIDGAAACRDPVKNIEMLNKRWKSRTEEREGPQRDTARPRRGKLRLCQPSCSRAAERRCRVENGSSDRSNVEPS